MVNWYDNEMNAASESWTLSEAADGHLVLPKEPTMRNDSIIPSPLINQQPSDSTITKARWKRVQQRLAVISVTDSQCWYCGTDLDVETFHIDHFIPLSQGGGEGDNLVPACYRCNCSKHARSLEEWRANEARKRAGVPLFSPDQRAWLDDQGFIFPRLPHITFWFEEQGLDR